MNKKIFFLLAVTLVGADAAGSNDKKVQLGNSKANLDAAIKDAQAAYDAANYHYDEYRNAIENAKNGLIDHSKAMQGHLGGIAADSQTGVQQGVNQVKDHWNNGISNSKAGIQNAIPNIQGSASNVRDTAYGAIGDAHGHITNAIPNVQAGVSGVKNAIKDGFNKSKGSILDSVPHIRDGLSKIKQGIKSGDVDAVADGYTKVKEHTTNSYNSVIDNFNGAVPQVVDHATNAVVHGTVGVINAQNTIKNSVPVIQDHISQTHEHIQNAIKDAHSGVQGAVPGIKGGISKVADHVTQGISDSHQSIDALLPESETKGKFQRLRDKLVNVVDTTHDTIQTQIPQTQDAVGNVHDGLSTYFNNVHDTIQGAISGVGKQQQQQQQQQQQFSYPNAPGQLPQTTSLPTDNLSFDPLNPAIPVPYVPKPTHSVDDPVWDAPKKPVRVVSQGAVQPVEDETARNALVVIFMGGAVTLVVALTFVAGVAYYKRKQAAKDHNMMLNGDYEPMPVDGYKYDTI